MVQNHDLEPHSQESEHKKTAQLIETLTLEDATELSGTEEGVLNITGRRRILFSSPNSSASVAYYNQAHRQHMGEIISDELGLVVDSPIGHVQFGHTAGDSMIWGALYVTESSVLSRFSFRLSPDDISTGVAQECFSAAESYGVGDQWTNHLLAQLRGENVGESQSVVVMCDPTVARLNQELINLSDA